jgi:hypothetical protein
MSEDAPTYGEALMDAVSVEAQSVLAFMADVQKMRALSAEVAAIDPATAAETQKLNLQIARSLQRQRKLLQEFLDRGEGTADDRAVASEYLRLIIHAQADLKAGGLEAGGLEAGGLEAGGLEAVNNELRPLAIMVNLLIYNKIVETCYSSQSRSFA